MRSIFYIIYIALFFVTSCKKDELEVSSIASLNTVTAVIDGGNVKLNTNERDSAKSYNSKLFIIRSGNSIVRLYPTNDNSIVYFNQSVQTEAYGIYSLFLAGAYPTIETVLVKDNLPPMYSDSTFGIRVINLSPNSSSVDITLAADTKTNLFSEVPYKQLTEFIKLPLPTTIPSGSVSIQVRDHANASLLATYTLPTSVNSLYPGISIALTRFRNLTLVVKGLKGTTSGTNAFGIFPVANY